MDQIAALRTFMRIVETGSITKAAASLDIPKSTASKQLSDLEVHLSTKLFTRSTRFLSLTPEGADYYDQVSHVLLKLNEADRSVQEKGRGPQGRIRVDVPSSIAHAIIIPALEEFRALYPGIEIALGISDRPVSLIEEAVDCVVRLGRLSNTSLIAKTIYRDRLITCASPVYLGRHGTPSTPEDLSSHDLIGYFSPATGGRKALVFRKGEQDIEITETKLVTNDSAGYAAMILSGLGIGQVYQSTVENEIATGDLVEVLPDWTNFSAPISILYPPANKLNARVRTFIDWLTEHVRRRRRVVESAKPPASVEANSGLPVATVDVAKPEPERPV